MKSHGGHASLEKVTVFGAGVQDLSVGAAGVLMRSGRDCPMMDTAGSSGLQWAPTHPLQGVAEPFRQCGSIHRENRFKKAQKILY